MSSSKNVLGIHKSMYVRKFLSSFILASDNVVKVEV